MILYIGQLVIREIAGEVILVLVKYFSEITLCHEHRKGCRIHHRTRHLELICVISIALLELKFVAINYLIFVCVAVRYQHISVVQLNREIFTVRVYSIHHDLIIYISGRP